jgi:uncharacterized protein (TIGR00299 family) protein
MKSAYLDCFSGISGDMFLGALIDSGLPFEALQEAMGTLPVKGYRLEARGETKNHLHGTRFIVHLEEPQPPRGLKEIEGIMNGSALSDRVKERSLRVFTAIAREEGKIHNHPPDKVHFHEVGALDSILDIAGTLFGVEALDIQDFHASSIPLGSGFVETQHGRLPLPAPATMALLKGIPVHPSGLAVEMVTPTGAALLGEVVSSFGTMPPMVIKGIGYGVGSRDLPDRPNLLRLVLGEDQAQGQRTETVVLLETNVDDTQPEWFGFLMDRLFEAGALDVYFCPVQMKKNRPGILIQVLGLPHDKDLLMDILFQETTTLGVRFTYTHRRTLDRTTIAVHSPWGEMVVKKVKGPHGSSLLVPEYESCRRIAEKTGRPLREIYQWIATQSDPSVPPKLKKD